MTDTTTPASGSPTDQAPQQEVGTPQEEFDHAQGGDQGEGDEGQPVPTEEVEVGGRKYVVPAAVKPLLMTQADYTRKTQAVAEKDRAIEAERVSHRERVKSDLQLIGEGREIVTLEWQLEQLQAMTPQEFSALQRQDPDKANLLTYRLQQLQGELNQKRTAYSQKISERQSAAERERATRKDQAAPLIAREVEGWSPALQDTLRTFSTSELKLTPQQFEGALEDPNATKVLHLAYLGAQSLKKAKAAVAQTTTQPAPTRTVGGGGSSASNGLSDRMSPEQWMKSRQAQLRKR